MLIFFYQLRFEPLNHESFQTIQQALITYIRSEYVVGSAEADASCESDSHAIDYIPN
jgi:hypothetical protein